MNRSVKKFLYALLCLGIFACFVFFSYLFGQIGRRGDSESSALSRTSYTDLPEVLDAEIFRLREAPASFLFGKVRNVSADYGYRFSYEFSLYDEADALLSAARHEATISPSSEIFLSDIIQNVPSRNVFRVSLKILGVERVLPHEFPLVDFSFSSDPQVEISPEGRFIRVFGAFRNNGGTFIPEARAVAILRDEFGFQMFAAETTLLNIRSFSEKNFEIPVSYDADLARRLQGGGAEVYVYPVF